MPAVATPSAPAAPAAPANTPAPSTPAAPTTPSAPAAPAPGAGGSPTPPAPDAAKKFTPGNFDDIDHLAIGDDIPAKPAGDKADPAPAPDAKKDKPAPTPGEPELDEEGVPKNFKTNKELRQWAVSKSQTAKQAADTVKALEAKIADLEKKPGREAEVEELNKKLKLVETRVSEYEQKIQFLDYRESDDYKNKYVVPFDEATAQAFNDIKELEVQVKDPQTEEITTRPGTKQDFIDIYNASLGQANRMANEMFGPSAMTVLQHRAKLKDLERKSNQALEDHKKNGAEIRKQQQQQQEAEMAAFNSTWEKVNNDITTKNPQWFKPKEGDEEGNKLLEKGYALVDAAMGPNRSSLTLQQRIVADANIRNRAAGFGRLAYMNKKLAEEVAAKDKIIEQLRASSPGGRPTTGSGEAPSKKKTWEEAMDELPEKFDS